MFFVLLRTRTFYIANVGPKICGSIMTPARENFKSGVLISFYVVRWDGKTPSPLGEYFSISKAWNIRRGHIVYMI